ncbi:exosome complex exonuclease rrp44 [Theileria orientalis]|uniref:Ribosomal RNA-processing protein 44 n=1 Tax=Theileria orientalis TaxID=68886 RepID=A0A976M9L3_THEOR|nr:exosome complex exonuclease rrp44 [Theileria orientalis]
MFQYSTVRDLSVSPCVRRFWKVSGKSNLKRVVREVYFRSDIGCGVDSCKSCFRSESQGTLDSSSPILILTIEVFTKHFDVCDKYLKNCVIPATVSNEIRRRSLNLYGCLKKLVQNSDLGGYYIFSNENFKDTYVAERVGETVIDRDNRAIYECALWYSKHLSNQNIYLVTTQNSALYNNQDGVCDFEVETVSNLKVVTLYELYDLFPSRFEGMLEHLPAKIPEPTTSGTERGVYPAYLSETEIQEGIERGQLFVGVLHMYIGSYQRGYVACGKEEFKVTSLLNLNRALDNDQVVIELVNADDTVNEEVPGEHPEDKVGTEELDVSIVDGHMEPEQYKVLKRECRVVAILKTGRREFCGSLLPLENVHIEGYTERMFVPVDARIPFVSIETKRSKQLDNKRIVVRIDSWDRFSRRPQGHWTEIIGDIDNRDVEAKVILREHEVITEDFSLKSYKELNEVAHKLIKPKESKYQNQRTNGEMEVDMESNFGDIHMDSNFGDIHMDSNFGDIHMDSNFGDIHMDSNFGDLNVDPDFDAELDGVVDADVENKHVYSSIAAYELVIDKQILETRVDYRNELVFSVDPPGCEDIDDALGCKTLENGNFEVSVHIADVTHFVHEGSNLDREASQRCTTVYLVDRRTDMLPKLLTTNLCSLMENVNRLTFSVYWEIDPNGVILNTWFSKSVIRSKRALSYKQAQELIDSNSSDEMCVALRNLNNIAKILRKQRMKRGAVELESSEVKFEFDLEKVQNLESYKTYDTNKMIEEFMLLANISVATKIYERFPKFALLRIHPPPFEEKLNELKRTLQQHGVQDFKYGNSKQLNESLDNIGNSKTDKFVSATKILTTRTMSQALYRNSNDLNDEEFKHYGLCCEYYTHFTSPIRRYADVIVHRLLASALDLTPVSTNLASNLTSQCDVLNRKHRNAQWCSRESDKMFSYLYFKNMENVESPGILLDINEDRVVVLSSKYGIEAVANVNYSSFDKVNKCLVDQNGNKFRVFDQVNIRLFTSNKYFRNMIKAEIISQ